MTLEPCPCYGGPAQTYSRWASDRRLDVKLVHMWAQCANTPPCVTSSATRDEDLLPGLWEAECRTYRLQGQGRAKKRARRVSVRDRGESRG